MEILTENSYISIGLVITVLSAMGTLIYKIATISTKLKDHLESKSLHHNIINMIQSRYVNRYGRRR